MKNKKSKKRSPEVEKAYRSCGKARLDALAKIILSEDVDSKEAYEIFIQQIQGMRGVGDEYGRDIIISEGWQARLPAGSLVAVPDQESCGIFLCWHTTNDEESSKRIVFLAFEDGHWRLKFSPVYVHEGMEYRHNYVISGKTEEAASKRKIAELLQKGKVAYKKYQQVKSEKADWDSLQKVMVLV